MRSALLLPPHTITCPLLPQRPLSIGLREVFGEPFGLRWFLPVDIPREAQYHWKKTDNPDAFNVRDPLYINHKARMEAAKRSGAPVPAELSHAGLYVHQCSWRGG